MRTALITFALLLIVCGAWATTPNTITLDGVSTDFQGDEAMGTSGLLTLHVTWDATNLYVGIMGRDGTTPGGEFLGDTGGTNDSLFIAIDTDQTNGSGGASDGYTRVNFTNTNYLPERVYYYAGGGGWYEYSTWNGAAWDWPGWSNVNSFYGYQVGNGTDEFTIPFADLGNPTAIVLYAWNTPEGVGQVDEAWPVGNATGVGPVGFHLGYHFNNLGAGVSPNGASIVPVELSVFQAD